MAEEAFKQAGLDVTQEQLNSFLAEASKYVDLGQVDEIARIGVKHLGKLTKAIKEQLLDLVKFGDEQASKELKVTPAPVSKETRAQISARATVTAEKIATGLKARTVYEILNGVAAGAGPKETLLRAKLAAQDYMNIELGGHAGAQVNYAINTGRNLAAEKARCRKAQYSAILDDSVCELCESLDGMIIETDHPDFDRFTPPVHGRCRCIWAYILPEEDPDPDVTWKTPPEGVVEKRGGLVSKRR
ncbi:MAG: minor capsid protein [Candidatus Desulforudaceae bacterium]|nr:minor capsid protein [Clostridia bacterium]